jgi:hypothetical protein
MKTYSEAVEILNGREIRKVDNNTYLEKLQDGSIGLRLHDTHVVKYLPDDTVVLDSGGWRTVTTKDRINNYAPIRLWQNKGIWYVNTFLKGPSFFYEDKMKIKGGQVVAGKPFNGEQLKAAKKEKQVIKTYVSGYLQALRSGQIEAPSAGDCFYCAMKTKEGATLGEASRNNEHLQLHMEEKYYVPSLVVRAMEMFGASSFAKQVIGKAFWGEGININDSWEWGIASNQIEKMLIRYIQRQFGYAS